MLFRVVSDILLSMILFCGSDGMNGRMFLVRECVNDGVVPPTVRTYLIFRPDALRIGELYEPTAVIRSNSYNVTQFIPPSNDSSIRTSRVGDVPATAVTGIVTWNPLPRALLSEPPVADDVSAALVISVNHMIPLRTYQPHEPSVHDIPAGVPCVAENAPHIEYIGRALVASVSPCPSILISLFFGVIA